MLVRRPRGLPELHRERDHLVAELAQRVADRLERALALVGDEHAQRLLLRSAIAAVSARRAGA